jgi:alkanesulfonate monooxygenase SsuD/methylene tetrahydromethanopterin reductase-like flavin-dependent oxidoreductase (luciferase family)
VCEHGDAWFPSMIPAGRVAGAVQTLRRAASRAGRVTPGIVVGGAVLLRARRSASDAWSFTARLADRNGLPRTDAEDVPIIGDAESAAERFSEYVDTGAQYLVLGSIGEDWRRQWELIAEGRALLT